MINEQHFLRGIKHPPLDLQILQIKLALRRKRGEGQLLLSVIKHISGLMEKLMCLGDRGLE